MMGVLVGLVLGGSQALARSMFAFMTPESRSAEFFGFFGFVGRASAVFGPTLYLLVTGIYDTRAAILAILIIIAVGSVLLQRVDTEEGRAVANGGGPAGVRGVGARSSALGLGSGALLGCAQAYHTRNECGSRSRIDSFRAPAGCSHSWYRDTSNRDLDMRILPQSTYA